VARDLESETEAAVPPAHDVALMKALEDPRHVLRGHADAAVAYDDLDYLASASGGDDDAAAFRSELHRVRDEVAEDLLEAHRVRADGKRVAAGLADELDRFRLRGDAERVDERPHGVAHVDTGELEVELPGRDARDV